MKKLLFKTKPLATQYLQQHYQGYSTRKCVDEAGDMEQMDFSSSVSGEVNAYMVEDEDLNTIIVLAWWSEGYEEYHLTVGDQEIGCFDNIFDAMDAKHRAEEEQEDEDEPLPVVLMIDGEIVG